MKALVDTHVLIWWYSDSKKLPRAYGKLLERTQSQGGVVGLAAISLWEIATLVTRGRLPSTGSLDELLSSIENDPLFEIIPIDGQIAAVSGDSRN